MSIARLLFFTIFSLSGATSIAADITLTQEYLGGKWSFDGKEGCNSNAAEYVVFHGNGLMEAGKGAVPKATGFWSTKDDEIILHLLVAPQESDTSNVFYRGRYTYSYLTAKVLETRRGAFDMISGTSGDMTRKTLTKCD